MPSLTAIRQSGYRRGMPGSRLAVFSHARTEEGECLLLKQLMTKFMKATQPTTIFTQRASLG